MSLRVGVLGVGAIGRNHARVYSQIKDVTLSCVYDINKDLAKKVAEECGTVYADSLEEFISLIDASSVSTPTSTHCEFAVKLLNSGKHVLVEKPISYSLDEAKQMIDLSNEKKLILQVGHIERFNPVMSQLEKSIDSPKFIECHRLSSFPKRSLDIGVVLDLMIHDLDIILYLVKSPVISIDAIGVPVLTKRDDIANVRLKFENGCVANITSSRISPDKMRKIRVFQNNIYISLDYNDQSGWIYKKDGLEIKKDKVQVEKNEPLLQELSSFINCIKKGEQPKVTGLHGAKALDIALEIINKINI